MSHVGMLERPVPGALERSPGVRTTSHWASETAGPVIPTIQQQTAGTGPPEHTLKHTLTVQT